MNQLQEQAKLDAQREANRISREKLRIESAKYNDEKARSNAILEAEKASEIALNPIKAYDYGYPYTFKIDKSLEGYNRLPFTGFISYNLNAWIPHASLLQWVGAGRLENISDNGITIELMFQSPKYNYTKQPYLNGRDSKKLDKRNIELIRLYEVTNKPLKKNYKNNKEAYKPDLERYYEICDSLDNLGYWRNTRDWLKFHLDIRAGEMFPTGEGDSAYAHKTSSVKRIVHGHSGFRTTLIWEDDYEKAITDNYFVETNGTIFTAKARYKADKESDITFEELEGRRHYFIKLIDKLVAQRSISNVVYSVESKSKPKRRNFNNSSAFLQAWTKWQEKYN